MTIRSKHLLVACCAALFALPTLNAQAGPGAEGRREGRAGQMGERIGEALDLTDAQRDSLKALNQEEVAAMKALRDDNTVAQGDKRAKLQEMRNSYQDKRMALMTPEQRTKAEAMRGKMAERMEKRRPGAGEEGAARPERPRRKQN